MGCCPSLLLASRSDIDAEGAVIRVPPVDSQRVVAKEPGKVCQFLQLISVAIAHGHPRHRRASQWISDFETILTARLLPSLGSQAPQAAIGVDDGTAFAAMQSPHVRCSTWLRSVSLLDQRLHVRNSGPTTPSSSLTTALSSHRQAAQGARRLRRRAAIHHHRGQSWLSADGAGGTYNCGGPSWSGGCSSGRWDCRCGTPSASYSSSNRQDGIALPGAGNYWPRWHGSGLSCRGHQAGPPGRHEIFAGGDGERRAGATALRA